MFLKSMWTYIGLLFAIYAIMFSQYMILFSAFIFFVLGFMDDDSGQITHRIKKIRRKHDKSTTKD